MNNLNVMTCRTTESWQYAGPTPLDTSNSDVNYVTLRLVVGADDLEVLVDEDVVGPVDA